MKNLKEYLEEKNDASYAFASNSEERENVFFTIQKLNKIKKKTLQNTRENCIIHLLEMP